MRVSAQDNPLGRGLDEAFPHLPPCYFSRPCGFCSSVPTLPVHVVASRGGVEDCALPAQEVSQRDLKKLMDAHVRFGHRNFRSLAKALCLKLPSKMPFCTACVEAKATRHPKSRNLHPPRDPAVRPGSRIHFDPFGPFPDRLADGSWYGLLFVDAFSSLLWLDMLPALKHWFDRLRALVTRVESEKGSNRVVAELACDFAPTTISS